MPMRRARLQTALLVAVLMSSTRAFGVPPSILGRSFVARDGSAGTDPTRRRVTVAAKEKASPTALDGEPTAVGAALVVDALPVGGQTFALPASAWRAVKGGFAYADRSGSFGAVQRVLVRGDARGTFTLKAKLSGAHAQLDVVRRIRVPRATSRSSSTTASRTARTSAARPAARSRTTARGSSR
jgi:hypothetical protein